MPEDEPDAFLFEESESNDQGSFDQARGQVDRGKEDLIYGATR
jgi:hypothetical protein